MTARRIRNSMTTSANTNRRWKKPLSVKELTTPTNQSSSSIIKIVQSTAALLISQLVEFSGNPYVETANDAR